MTRIPLDSSRPNHSQTEIFMLAASFILWSISSVVIRLRHTQPSSLSIRSDGLVRSVYYRNKYFLTKRSASIFKKINRFSFAIYSPNVSSTALSITSKGFFIALLLSNFLHTKPFWIEFSATESFWMTLLYWSCSFKLWIIPLNTYLFWFSAGTTWWDAYGWQTYTTFFNKDLMELRQHD